jgi:hypothetical protein
MLAKLFSRGVLKLILALSIPLGIAALWIYSQKMANLEVEQYKQEQKINPNTDRISVDNYALREIDDHNHIRWQLVARQGVFEPTNKDVALADVKVEYFDDQKLKMRLSAPVGTANETSRYVKLDAQQGKRVVAEGEEGKARMEAQKVELTKKNQFVASGGVNIVWTGVAKVTGNSATGSLEKGAALKDLKIIGNTHALIGHI